MSRVTFLVSEGESGVSVGVVICAGGKGKRMQLGKNKQFLELQGKPLLIHTLEVFSRCTAIDTITLVVAQDEVEFVVKLAKQYQLTEKLEQVVVGGAERQDSVYQGLLSMGEKSTPEYVFIHDGARPFVTMEDINKIVKQVKLSGAAILAVPITDTIKKVTSAGIVAETLDRSVLWAVQTPQAFKYSLILKAHQEARKEGFLGTDDASLVERLGIEVRLVQGSYNNIKLTTLEDVQLAEYLLQRSRLSK